MIKLKGEVSHQPEDKEFLLNFIEKWNSTVLNLIGSGFSHTLVIALRKIYLKTFLQKGIDKENFIED